MERRSVLRVVNRTLRFGGGAARRCAAVFVTNKSTLLDNQKVYKFFAIELRKINNVLIAHSLLYVYKNYHERIDSGQGA